MALGRETDEWVFMTECLCRLEKAGNRWFHYGIGNGFGDVCIIGLYYLLVWFMFG